MTVSTAAFEKAIKLFAVIDLPKKRFFFAVKTDTNMDFVRSCCKEAKMLIIRMPG